MRVPSNDFNKLIVALKLKFLDALDPAERAEQVDCGSHKSYLPQKS